MIFKSINPYNQEILGEYKVFAKQEIVSRLEASARAYKSWKNLTLSERLAYLEKLAQLIEDRADSLSYQMAEEMGKTYAEARAEVLKCATGIRFFIGNSPEWLATETVESDARLSLIMHQPLGGILLVMPWNFPLWQVLRAAVPALCVGNAVVLKHAPNVMRYAHTIENLFLEAGFPEHVFTNLVIDVPDLEQVVSHPAIAAVSLTGSENAGRSMAALAGKYLKKCVLELGGSDPFIVLPDADLNFAGDMAAKARLINNGQSCIAAKRFLVHQAVEKEFLTAFITGLEKFRPGNPVLSTTTLGPQARKDLAENLHSQLQQSIAQGAELCYKMDASVPEGSFFLPTIVRNVQPGMVCFDDEVFGPIAAITTYTGQEELVALANHTRFGLGASIYTANEQNGLKLAPFLDCGTVAINTMVRSKPALPFGGIKASGYGKELSRFGLLEFSNAKSVILGG